MHSCKKSVQSIHVNLLIQLFLHLQIILSCIREPFFQEQIVSFYQIVCFKCYLGTLIQSKQLCSHITDGFNIVFLFIFITADDKTPKSCRSTLAQLSLNSMKSAGVCIGRPILLTSPAGQQEVCLLWFIISSDVRYFWCSAYALLVFVACLTSRPVSLSSRCVWDGRLLLFPQEKLVCRNVLRVTSEWSRGTKYQCTRWRVQCFGLSRWSSPAGSMHLIYKTKMI